MEVKFNPCPSPGAASGWELKRAEEVQNSYSHDIYTDLNRESVSVLADISLSFVLMIYQ